MIFSRTVMQHMFAVHLASMAREETQWKQQAKCSNHFYENVTYQYNVLIATTSVKCRIW